jgi:hypothetical protein
VSGVREPHGPTLPSSDAEHLRRLGIVAIVATSFTLAVLSLAVCALALRLAGVTDQPGALWVLAVSTVALAGVAGLSVRPLAERMRRSITRHL